MEFGKKSEINGSETESLYSSQMEGSEYGKIDMNGLTASRIQKNMAKKKQDKKRKRMRGKDG